MNSLIDETTLEPAVSVCVITYNMERYLPMLLDSILMQKVDFPYEIVVDDDCSPDDSRNILLDYQRRFPDRLILSLRDENIGGSRNMYGVLRRARGKYIAILEGDDWWEVEDKLQYQYDFLEEHPEYVAMYCNTMTEYSLDGSLSKPRRETNDPIVFTFEDFKKPHFLDRLPCSTDTVMFRNFFASAPEKEVGVFYKAHPMVWDQSLALILYGKGDVYFDPRVVSHHRSIVCEDGDNYQSRYAREDQSVSDAAMYACHEEYIEAVLHRSCGGFCDVRGDIYAEQFWMGTKNNSLMQRQQAMEIWRQRAKKLPLVWRTCIWGCESLKRKIKRIATK